ncbi:MAG: alr0857 family protein [Cyanobacteria bacterium P01_F01_bin.150]
MLKLNYTDLGLHMEHVTASVDVIVAQYVLVAMRLGKSMHVEQSRASFLMPADSITLTQLQDVLQHGCDTPFEGEVAIAPVDHAFVEISMSGTWMSEALDGDVGIFLTSFDLHTEYLLHQIWQETQRQTSLLS